jgi:hypothetical protein
LDSFIEGLKNLEAHATPEIWVGCPLNVTGIQKSPPSSSMTGTGEGVGYLRSYTAFFLSYWSPL